MYSSDPGFQQPAHADPFFIPTPAASVTHHAPGRNAASASAFGPAVNWEVESDDSDDGSPRKTVKLRCLICLFVVALLSLSTVLVGGITPHWQHSVVMARPNEVYAVYSTVTGILGEASNVSAEDPRFMSTKPEAVYHIYSGLRGIEARHLCDPQTPAFQAFVSESDCLKKLEYLCEDLKRNTNINALGKVRSLATRPYERCMKTIAAQRGVSIPLLAVPDPRADAQEQEDEDEAMNFLDKALTGLHRDSESTGENAASEDGAPDYCDTVAHCDRLRTILPLMIAIFVSFISGTTALLLANGLLLGAIVTRFAGSRHSPKLTNTGCWFLACAALFLMVSCSTYGYTALKWPVKTLVRRHDLFYFTFPGTGGSMFDGASNPVQSSKKKAVLSQVGSLVQVTVGQHAELIRQKGARRWKQKNADQARPHLTIQARLGTSVDRREPFDRGKHGAESRSSLLALRENSMARGQLTEFRVSSGQWHRALQKLTGALLQALMADDMSVFFDRFRDAMASVWKMADSLFDRWLELFKDMCEKGSSEGLRILRNIVAAFPRVDKVILKCGDSRQCKRQTKERGVIDKDLEDLRESEQGMNTDLQDIKETSGPLIEALRKLWRQTFKAIEFLISIFPVVVDGAQGLEKRDVVAVVGAVKVLAKHQDDLTRSLRVVFATVFTALPRIVTDVRRLSAELFELIKTLTPFPARVLSVQRRAAAWGQMVEENKLGSVEKAFPENLVKVSEAALSEFDSVFFSGAALSQQPDKVAAAQEGELGVRDAPAFSGRVSGQRPSGRPPRPLPEKNASEEVDVEMKATSSTQAEMSIALAAERFSVGSLASMGQTLGLLFLSSFEKTQAKDSLHSKGEGEDYGRCALHTPGGCSDLSYSFFSVAFATVVMMVAVIAFQCGCCHEWDDKA